MLRPADRTLDVRRPFTTAQAAAAGLDASALRRAEFQRLFRGVHVHSSVPRTQLLLVEAALLLHPSSAFASHTSAARAYGVPVPSSSTVHVGVRAEKDRRRRDGIRHHVAPDVVVLVHRGLRVSAPLEVFVELAELLDLVDLVVVGDAFVRLGCFSPEELRAHCRATSRAGVRAARRAAAYVRRGVDSPMETRLRMLIVLAGLPEPAVNHTIVGRDGRVLLRFDLGYPEARIAVEYDGRQHRDDLDHWDHDLDRGDWFDAHDWRHVVVVARGIYREPEKTLRRVQAALRSRGVALPRQLSQEWRAHFPGRG
jgi:hypothetical protein